MGLKLKWFRRRITFEGVPRADERNIRRKETTSGTVTGVYRQSAHFEDFIEPVSSSYWTPPPQAIARATFRPSKDVPTPTKPAEATTTTSNNALLRTQTPTESPTTSSTSSPPPPVAIRTGISSVSRPHSLGNGVIGGASDKIGERVQYTGGYEMPPEPTYAAPQPPVRKNGAKFAKARSVGNLSVENNGASVEKMLSGQLNEAMAVPHSVEVLLDTTHHGGTTSTPSPPSVQREQQVVVPMPRSASSNSLPIRDVTLEVKQELPREREVNLTSDYVESLATEERQDEEPIYDSFQAIFERVKIRKPANPAAERSDTTSSASEVSEVPSPPSELIVEEQPTVTEPPKQPSPTVPKSILKKRAPPPPELPPITVEATSSMVNFPTEPVIMIPTPPPRTTRITTTTPAIEELAELPSIVIVNERIQHESKPTPMPLSNGAKNDDSDDSDDFNWDFVQRHRSSINQTVAAHTQIDPEVLRNAPASLRNGPPGGLPSTRGQPEPIAQPRTLRGMRNQRVHQLDNNTSRNGVAASATALEVPPRKARASDSNESETSA